MIRLTKAKKTACTALAIPMVAILTLFLCVTTANSQDKYFQPQEQLASTALRFTPAQPNLDMRDFTFTEYTKTKQSLQKVVVLCGGKTKTGKLRLGIFGLLTGKVIELKNPEITFSHNNETVSHARSDSGTISMKNQSLPFSGNVTLIAENTSSPKKLLCQNLLWDNKRQFILANGDCVLVTDSKPTTISAIKTNTSLSSWEHAGPSNKKSIKNC